MQIWQLLELANRIVYNLIMDNENISTFDSLALKNQLCFALYVCSKEIIKRYGPFLDKHQLTYTSYITLMSLWEKDNVTVKQLGEQLYLDSGTLTPLLKKMENQGFITRERSKEDERTVYIKLTEEGRALKEQCRDIPVSMACQNLIDFEKAPDLLQTLHDMMEKMK